MCKGKVQIIYSPPKFYILSITVYSQIIHFCLFCSKFDKIGLCHILIKKKRLYYKETKFYSNKKTKANINAKHSKRIKQINLKKNRKN